jgi:phosphonate transport system substrate-binding protein
MDGEKVPSKLSRDNGGLAEVDHRATATSETMPTPGRPAHLGYLVAVLAFVAAVAAAVVVASLRPTGLDGLFSAAPTASLGPRSAGPPTSSIGTTADAPAPPLRIAIAPVISPEASLGLYRGLVDYLAESLGREGTLLLQSSYSETNALLRLKQCDVAFVCTNAFVMGERDFGMQAIVVPVVHGVTVYRSFLIVPRQSRASSLLDLRGFRFGSGDLLSTTGWLYPAQLLRREGQNPDRFFSEHVVTGSHDRSVRATANGLVDGAAVDSLVYEHLTEVEPELAAKTKVIAKSPEYGMPPIVVHPEISATLKAGLVDAMTKMHLDATGKAVLTSLDIDRFAVPDPETWDAVRALVDERDRAP